MYFAPCVFLWEGGRSVATTRLMSLHINKGKTIAQTITDRTDYAGNPDKTKSIIIIT